MKKLLIILVIILFCQSAFAEDFNNVKFIRNHDGDTITFDLGPTIPPLWRKSRVRLQGIDTPEVSTENQAEKTKGLMVRDFVCNELVNAKIINLRNCSLDKYGRPLCAVNYDEKDLTNELLKRNYGYAYFGEKKNGIEYSK